MQERYSAILKRRFTKIFAALLAFVLVTGGGAVSAVPAASTAPDWIKHADGIKDDPEQQEKNEELEKWREEKKNVKVPILLYHHITNDTFTTEQSISHISPDDFRLHMTAIKVHYNPISLRKYIEYVNCDDGSVTIPENPIVVTFDDGYSSNYEIAYPILKQLEIPATIFVVTDTVGEQSSGGRVHYSHFTWDQAREMEASGLIEIQSHTAGHIGMTTVDAGEQIRQFRKSKYEIEKNLGHKCDMIAYPYGDYDENVKQEARNSGYTVQLLVDDKTTENDYDVNLPSEGVENLTRMTIAGSMGNVNVIEIIRKTVNKKVIPQ